jgi:flagellar hook-associated protein 2
MSTTSSTSSSTAANSQALLQLSGLASGINWQSLVSQLIQVEAAPEAGMQAQQTTYGTDKTDYQNIGTDLTKLGTDISTLTAPNFFDSRTATASDTSVATATAATGTALGTYTFNVTKLASDAVMQGTKEAGAALSPTNDVSTLVLGTAGFADPVTAGTFSVNGQTVTIATTDTLQAVFDKITAATTGTPGGAVTGSYNAATDEITLSGSGTIVLGSATDTSNFLQAAKLYNNGTSAITSTSALGGVNLNSDVGQSNLATPITDGGSGNGEFMINGVAINFNASTDSINNILTAINNSTAGVTATYDPVNNRFLLTDKSTGDVGISLQDVTGNFLAATGLSSGTLARGNNLEYNINNGGTLTSQSNTIDGSSSGISGLTVNVLNTGTTSVTVGSDTSTISSAIENFVSDYNTVQNYISSLVATTTNSSGNVIAGPLTGDLNVEDIATTLRGLVDAVPGGLTSSTISSLNDMGITSNGNDNTLAIADTSTITAALTNNLSSVESLFTDPTSGLATTVASYIKGLTGTTGVLATAEKNFTTESDSLTQSITQLQAKVTSDQTTLTNEFVAMESAINSINQQKQYLTDYFGSSAATSSSSTSASGL